MAFTLQFTLIVASGLSTIATASENVTGNKTDDVKPFSCRWNDLEFPITYGPAIGCCVCVMIGFVEIIFGHKYQKTALFLVGFSGGALFTYVICIVRSTLLIYYILLITALIAILLGILCTTIVFCGLFAVGLGAGMCLSIAFLLAFSHLYAYETLSIPIGVVIGTSVLMAGATVWWKRVLLIISSSIYGGALIMGPVDYFVEDFWLLDYAWRKAFLVKYSGEPCLFSWIILGVWPLMSLVGLLVQFLKTGKRPPKRKKDRHRNKRYARSSPFYSAPEDTELGDLMHGQQQETAQPTAPLEDEATCMTIEGCNEQELPQVNIENVEQYLIEQYLAENEN